MQLCMEKQITVLRRNRRMVNKTEIYTTIKLMFYIRRATTTYLLQRYVVGMKIKLNYLKIRLTL